MAQILDTTLNFRCSAAELILLLELINLDSQAIFVDDPFADMPHDQITAAKSFIYKTLLARGYIALTSDNTYIVDNTLNKILNFCVYPQHLLMLTSSVDDSNIPSTEMYYILDEVTIQHYKPFADIHDFVILTQRPNFSQLIAEKVAATTSAIVELPVTVQLPEAVFLEIQQQIEAQNTTDALNQIMKAGNTQQNAQLLVSAIAASHLQLMIQIITPKDAKSAHQSLMLLCSLDNCWLISLAEKTPDTLPTLATLEIVTINQLKTKLDRFLRALRKH